MVRSRIVVGSLAMAAALLMGSAVQAQVLYDFEDGTAQGWAANDATTVGPIIGATGATNGSALAMQFGRNAPGAFIWSVRADWDATVAAAVSAASAAGGTIEFDISLDPSTMSAPLGFVNGELAMQSDADGFAFRQSGTVWLFDGQDPVVADTIHVVIPFATMGGNVHAGATAGNFQLSINGAWPADLISGLGDGSVHVDNFLVTPEPASLALLGLGGLAVLRRRGA